MPAASLIRHATLLGASVAGAMLLACSDAIEPPAQRDAIAVEGTVVDPAGDPVAGAYAVLRVWTSAKEPPWPGDAPYAVTASDGSYSVSEAELAGSVDSVTVDVYPPGCTAPLSRAVLEGRLLPADPDEPVEINVTADPISAPARSELGEVCAAGAEPFWGVRSFVLILQIESADAGVVSGRWGVYYNRTSVGPEGLFEGVAANGMIALDLEPDQASAPGCGGVHLVAPVSADGEWEAAQIVLNDRCMPDVASLTFTRNVLP